MKKEEFMNQKMCDVTTEELAEGIKIKQKAERNPAHICMGCDKYLGHRGFCSQKCHDKWYDEQYSMIEPSNPNVFEDSSYKILTESKGELICITTKEELRRTFNLFSGKSLPLLEKAISRAKELRGE